MNDQSLKIKSSGPKNAVVWFFGEPVVFQLVVIGDGNINDTWKLVISAPGQLRTFLLQRLNHLVFRQPEHVMANISKVALHLAATGYEAAILQPVPGPEGRTLFCDDDGNYWRVFPFFENTLTLEVAENPGQAFVAARAFGLFLAALAGLDAVLLHETIPGFHDSVTRLGVFQKAVAHDTAGRLREVESEVEYLLKESAVFHDLANLGLPLRVVHNDAKIANLLMNEQVTEAVAVIDWDTIMPGCLLSDLGDIARTMAASHSEDERDWLKVTFRMPVFQAICAGFLPPLRHMMTDSERHALHLAPGWIILEQAMRFLGDYLAGDTYYKISYPLHNLDRARNQLALHRSVRMQEEALQEAIFQALKLT